MLAQYLVCWIHRLMVCACEEGVKGEKYVQKIYVDENCHYGLG